MKLIIGALVAGATLLTPGLAQADTYTLEPFDLDGDGITQTVTQSQFGGTQCPCIKVPYQADGFHNQQGADNIDELMTNGTITANDKVMGFSLGSQVVSLYLSQHVPTPGVGFILAGDTFTRNDQLNAVGQGIPADIANPVTLVANEYDGWSDQPDQTASPGYVPAVVNAIEGAVMLHNYVNARLDDPANVVTQQGNITAVLVPTQQLPLDPSQRQQIDDAYSRPAPTPDQRAAAAAEQTYGPTSGAPEVAEPAASLP